jgi:hypothetical protein
VQLNSEDVPEGEMPGGPGLLQVFYCTECDAPVMEQPGAVMARIVRRTKPTVLAKSPFARDFPTLVIDGWTAKPDFPSLAESVWKGLDVLDDGSEALAEHQERYPERRDKLLGWPAWVQGVSYPTCATCGEAMISFMQIASEDHVPFMFGDDGIGHVSLCPRHPRQARFRWDCC